MIWIWLLSAVLQLTAGAVIITAPEDHNLFRYYTPTSKEELLKQDKNFWFQVAEDQLKRNIKFFEESKEEVAKNVVIFIGDGMGISTVTAARIYKGQREYGKSGEDHNLIYDEFPDVGLVKTYNVDKQVPDSAGTATAIFTGSKARYSILGLDVSCNVDNFNQDDYNKCKVDSLMSWAQTANKSTGIITTTRITHATPAATYAKVNDRGWECDTSVPAEYRSQIKDIPRQLIEDAPGSKFKVILGGGYKYLGYTFDTAVSGCTRGDNQNLTQAWLDLHNGTKSLFVMNNEGLDKVDDSVEYLLGLFAPDHVPYELERDKGPKGSPSLSDMVRKAVPILKKNNNGFVLLVEGGRIDHGHHDNRARLALEEAAQFDKAIQLVVNETGSETLIIVTADHSHALTVNGYADRGNDILGYDEDSAYLTLSYANGPGFDYHYKPEDSNSKIFPWRDPRNDSNLLNDPEYVQMSGIKLSSETHGGEDVGIFAKGAGSHYIRGVMEQNYIAHVVSYAACFGPRASMNKHCNGTGGSNQTINTPNFIYLLFFYLMLNFGVKLFE